MVSSLFAVILAGGSGTRFWPASRRLWPKQLLPLSPGSTHSLLRDTVTRLAPLIPSERVLISTGSHLLDATQAELPELGTQAFLAEPQAKNTAPCIAWAAQVIAELDPDGIVCVLPSDQHAADAAGFRDTLERAALAAQAGRIVTLGIVPTRAETGYGYIKRGPEQGHGYLVDGFFEKPDLKTAEQYLKSADYLWNAGIFVFRASVMLDAIRTHLPEVAEPLAQLARVDRQDAEAYQTAVAQYFTVCPKISIDYGVMEKSQHLMVVPGDFGWSDLGSWESAWELSPKDVQHNVAPVGSIVIDGQGNFIHDLRKDRQKKVIALVGVSDLCVVETEDALLILPRERSQDVRDVVEQLKATQREHLT